MGRRVRNNNSSPIDNVMEKYHNDIGNRLSGVYMPPHKYAEAGENIATDFCTLTLDNRHNNNMRVKNNNTPILPKVASDQSFDSYLNSSQDLLSDESSITETSTSGASFITNNLTDAESLKEKKSIVDKLARALFQRKHTCSRCQRRSKSCLPNKNFNGTEKHYMCGDCRENSYAIKNLFNGLSNTNCENSDPCLTSDISERVQPRTQLKDSGYDTVTSCSTLASAYSAFNTPETQEKFAKPNNKASPASSSKVKRSKSMPRVYSKPKPAVEPAPSQQYPSEFHHLVVVGHNDQLPGGILRPVKTRNIKNYDGYLPDPQCHHQQDCIQPTHNYQRSSPRSEPAPKMCHVCHTTSKPCFRLPWEGGWLCEDCIDGML